MSNTTSAPYTPCTDSNCWPVPHYRGTLTNIEQATCGAPEPEPWNCEQCFDTETIDRGGREIACPYCVAVYHPRSVTVVAHPDGGFAAFDRSQSVEGYWYGARCATVAQAEVYRNKRRGVIKAALTRRANKARNAR